MNFDHNGRLKVAKFDYIVFRRIILLLIIGAIVLSGHVYSQEDGVLPPGFELSGVAVRGSDEAVALDMPIDPELYRLGPGDKLTVFIWGAIQAQHELVVTPEGKLLFPNIGPIEVSGLYLSEAKSRIEKNVLRRYKNVEVTADLTGLRNFKVYITGAVKFPGAYEANGATRVSEAILKAGGFANEDVASDRWKISTQYAKRPPGIASHRGIIVRHVDGGIDTADVLIFEQAGELRYNFRLADGDEIFVPLRETKVNLYGIFGGVRNPGYYEYSPRDSLKDLIGLAHGLSINADSSTAELVRFNEDGRTTTKIEIDLKDILSSKSPDIHLLPDDRVYVRTLKYYHEKQQVLVIGEVKFPGFYAIKPESTYLKQVIEKAGGFTPLASLAEAEMTRFVSEEVRDREFERLKLMQVADMSELEYEYFKVKSRQKPGRVAVDFEQLFKGSGQGDIKLRDGDIIHIPRMSEVVVVSGEVANPGIVSYHPRYNYLDYIELAGGYSFRADKNKVRIITTVTGEWKKAKRKSKISPGDAILVPERKKINYLNTIKDIMVFAGNLATVYLVVKQATE